MTEEHTQPTLPPQFLRSPIAVEVEYRAIANKIRDCGEIVLLVEWCDRA